jgi:hypothetical protein
MRIVSLSTGSTDAAALRAFVEHNEADIDGIPTVEMASMFEDFAERYVAEEPDDFIEDVSPEIREGFGVDVVQSGPTEDPDTIGTALVHLSDIMSMADELHEAIGDLDEATPALLQNISESFDAIEAAYTAMDLGGEQHVVQDYEFAANVSDNMSQDSIIYNRNVPLDPFSGDILQWLPPLDQSSVVRGNVITRINEGAELASTPAIDENRLKLLARMGLIDKASIAPTIRAINELMNGKSTPSTKARALTNDLLLKLVGIITGDDSIFAKAKTVVS